MQIDPKQKGHLPKVDPPQPFESPDGKFRGWKVSIPGRHALATPAVADGLIFLGGGFGSYDFYAFDARDGRLAWQYQTSDDGPTAAVVEDEFVVFNTESCELEVLTTAGAPVWKKWLGDPLMSMPAVAEGRIYMAYPDTRGDRRHYLACFDLRQGDEIWRQPIAGELITAPVIAEGFVHFATLEGTLHRVRAEDGRVEWAEKKNATSSPVVWEGDCYFSQREERPDGATPGAFVQSEHLSRRTAQEAAYRAYAATSRKADYLDYVKRRSSSARYAASARRDAGVGFAASKGDAKMYQAQMNLGTEHVHGVWAYQGSKPFVSKGRLYAAHGDIVSSADPRSDAVYWKTSPTADGSAPPDAEAELLDSPLTPPAIVNGKLFFGSVLGAVHCLSAESGATLWTVPVGEPVVFQPAVVDGRVYLGTDSGSLICLETGDPGDDGWRMWGADARHNGRLD
ncbi:MAG: PQQ-binding-like beta-propeller repeat protein [Isosphaeraceae bacterium]